MNKLDKSSEFDSYEIEEPSDEERAISSSEDELDVLLNGTPEQKKKLIREYLTGESESSSGDEFEKEMEAELNSTIKTIEGNWAPMAAAETSGGGGGGAAAVGVSGPGNSGMYDKVYFDSDSEDEDTPSSSTGRKQRQRIIPTNDELLYDPDEDDRDQAWMDARRRAYINRGQSAPNEFHPGRPQGLPRTDAVLNCPACMSLLCMDCQRHDLYRNQYRAMFVMNCSVKMDEVLRYKGRQDGNRRKGRKRKKKWMDNQERDTRADPKPEGLDTDEVYHPVQCNECSTEVAVFDKDEVYHFFNILTSHY